MGGSVSEAVKPIFTLLEVTANSPTARLTFTQFRLLLTLFVNIVWVLIALYLTVYTLPEYFSRMEGFFYNFQYTTLILVFLSTYVLNSYYCRSTLNLLHRLESLRSSYLLQGWEFSLQTYLFTKRPLFFGVFLLIFWLSEIVLYDYSKAFAYLNLIPFYTPIIRLYLSVEYFAMFLTLLSQNFGFLSRTVSKFLKEPHLDRLISAYTDLKLLSKDVNDTFGSLVVIVSAFDFILTLQSWFLGYTYYFYNYTQHLYLKKKSRTAVSLCFFIWPSFSLFNLWVMANETDKVVQQARHFKEILCDEVSRQLMSGCHLERFPQILNVLSSEGVDFHACNLFRINKGLFASMVATLTMYLVILIQFRAEKELI